MLRVVSILATACESEPNLKSFQVSRIAYIVSMISILRFWSSLFNFLLSFSKFFEAQIQFCKSRFPQKKYKQMQPFI